MIVGECTEGSLGILVGVYTWILGTTNTMGRRTLAHHFENLPCGQAGVPQALLVFTYPILVGHQGINPYITPIYSTPMCPTRNQ